MPLFGQLDLAAHASRAPSVTKLLTDAEGFFVEHVDVLAFTYEIDIQRGFGVTPKALHPSIPSYCQLVVRRHRDSPLGAFNVAELRINATTFRSYDTRSDDRPTWVRAAGIKEAVTTIRTKVGL